MNEARSFSWKTNSEKWKAQHDDLMKKYNDVLRERDDLEVQNEKLNKENFKLQGAIEEWEEKYSSSQSENKPHMVAELQKTINEQWAGMKEKDELIKQLEDELKESKEWHKKDRDLLGKTIATQKEDIEALHQDLLHYKAAHDHLQDYVGALGKVRV